MAGNVTLNIWLRQIGAFLYADILAERTPLLTGIVCLTGTPLFLSRALFAGGEFIFSDTQGQDDPHYSGLGNRWQLYYTPY